MFKQAQPTPQLARSPESCAIRQCARSRAHVVTMRIGGRAVAVPLCDEHQRRRTSSA